MIKKNTTHKQNIEKIDSSIPIYKLLMSNNIIAQETRQNRKLSFFYMQSVI